MKRLFQVASGSITGRNHALIGKNNQDAYYSSSDETATIALVSDGCSGGEHSEVGAKLGVRIVAEAIISHLREHKEEINSDFWQKVRQQTLIQLETITKIIIGKNEFLPTISDYFMFTIVGTIITTKETTIFSIGDGVVAINGQIKLITSRIASHAPPYLGYSLCGHSEWSQIQIHHQCPTEQIQSILIGTDGVNDLIEAEDNQIPSKAEKVGEIAHFWQDDRYFCNPDMIRRRLSLINREIIKPDWQNQQLNKQCGLLTDDTTLIVIRRTMNNE
jgi:hypothetical protein